MIVSSSFSNVNVCLVIHSRLNLRSFTITSTIYLTLIAFLLTLSNNIMTEILFIIIAFIVIYYDNNNNNLHF